MSMRRCSGLLLSLSLCLPAADPWDALSDISRRPAAEAEPALETLLREHPGFLAARYNLGTLLLEHDAAKAADHLQAATAAADPQLAADAWHNLALARWKQGRLEEALQAAESAAKGHPPYAAMRDELRRVALIRADEARRAAEEAAKRLALATERMPEARVGEPYRAAVPLRGGTAPITVAIDAPTPTGTTIALPPLVNAATTDPSAAAIPHLAPAPSAAPAAASAALPPGDATTRGGLPEGLSLASDGTISGTPTTAGTYPVRVKATDAAGAAITGTVSVVVLPTPTITTTSLPEAVLGQPYQVTLTAVGLHAPQWSASHLPPGLVMDAAGTITGTPTVAGTATIEVAAAEPAVPPLAGRRATRELPLVVSDRFAPDADPLPPATAGQPYRHRVGVRGPAQVYRWSAAAGPIDVAADGTISGTPSAEGEISRPATISAADGRSREVTLRLPVNPRPLIAQGDPIRCTAGAPVDQAIPHTGGTPPLTWTVREGNLPPGVRLDADGRLRGVAKDPGSYTVTVALQDRWKATTQAALSIEVAPGADPGEQKDESQQSQDGKDGQQSADQQQAHEGQQQAGDQGQQKPQAGDQHAGKDQQAGKDQPDQGNHAADHGKASAGADQPQAGSAPDAPKPAAQGADQQAADATTLQQMAADRWLDQLPAENRGVLRYQLLDGGERKPDPQQGPAW